MFFLFLLKYELVNYSTANVKGLCTVVLVRFVSFVSQVLIKANVGHHNNARTQIFNLNIFVISRSHPCNNLFNCR